MTDELQPARELARNGVPIFVAPFDPSRPLGFRFPKGWQNSSADERTIDRWREGSALVAVMGHGIDLLDVDPRNGGDPQALEGILPKVYAEQATPSGGHHFFVKSIGVASLDGILPGIDYKGGESNGRGRGCAFISPTVRESKITHQLVAYQWTLRPSFEGFDGDDSGNDLANHIGMIRASKEPGHFGDPLEVTGVLGWGVSQGHRDRTLFGLACSLRARGKERATAERHVLAVAARCVPPFPEAEALAKVAWVYSHYPAGSAGAHIEDFWAHLPDHRYIYVPTRELWPGSSVNTHVAPVTVGANDVPAAQWLDRHQHVEQMTWAPGLPMVIRDKLIADGGWIAKEGAATFNLYRPPTIIQGDRQRARPWAEHLKLVYPNEAGHIVRWLAHRVQRPQEKPNHALVLGGAQGIGKDTILEPVKQTIGPWNFAEVSPAALMGRFNGFAKSVVLRISEARDLGDTDRYAFYDHMKVYTAAPPDVLRVDEKNIREHAVPNVCGVIITTNHKTNGIYLPADDRRHFVAWSELTVADFDQDYFARLWHWLQHGGSADVAAFLATFDISDFDAKAPPPKTAAFWDIVDANSGPEDDDLTGCLHDLEFPAAVTIDHILDVAAKHLDNSFYLWLKDQRNRRAIPHRLEAAGYVSVRCDTRTDGRWQVDGRPVRIYAKKELSVRDRIIVATELAGAMNGFR